MRLIKASWLTSPSPGNFGDILTPYILSKYMYDVKFVRWNMIEDADVISVGSIARLAKKGISVLGSGILSRYENLDPAANWVWVRGPITRTRLIECGGECNEIYGDPALLLPRIYNPTVEKTHKVGIIPHHIDYEIVKSKYPTHKVINLKTDNVEDVIKDILSCEKIISSSLHGMIVANAYNIPAAWIIISKLVGDNTKFYDYAMSANAEIKLSSIDNPYYINPIINTDIIHNILKDGEF